MSFNLREELNERGTLCNVKTCANRTEFLPGQVDNTRAERSSA